MSCNTCLNYICIDLGIAACNDWVTVPIIPDSSGTWRIEVKGGNSFTSTLFVATEGEKIVLATDTFNENLTHIVKLFREDGTQFPNDTTCYKINTHPVSSAQQPDAPPTPDPSDCICVTPEMVAQWNEVPTLQDVLLATTPELTAPDEPGQIARIEDIPPPQDLSGYATTSQLATVATAAGNAQSTANAAIPLTQKGAANGVGTLDSNGKQPVAEAFFKFRRKEITGNYTVTPADNGVMLIYKGTANIILTFPASLDTIAVTSDSGFALGYERTSTGVITPQAGTGAILEHPLNYFYAPEKRPITVFCRGGNVGGQIVFNFWNTAP